MNVAANNALLKSLEEPPGDVVYLLVADSIAAIPATIQSRCQLLYFRPVYGEMMSEYLRQQGIDETLGSILQGSPLNSINDCLPERLTAREEILTQLQALLSQSVSPCQVSAAWQKLDHDFVLEVLLAWFRDLIKVKQGIHFALVYLSEQALLKKQAESMHIMKMFTILNKLMELIQHQTLARPVNMALWLDSLAIEMIN